MSKSYDTSPELEKNNDGEKSEISYPTPSSKEPKSNADSAANTDIVQDDENVFERFTPTQKAIITIVVSYGSFLSPLSSMIMLSAIPQIASHYNTTSSIIDISNASYMLSAGMSPFFVGTLSSVYGRKKILTISAALFTAFSLGTALAPTLTAFFIFRILTGFFGTAFLVVGSNCLGDVYRPTERATAIGWFLLGFQLGPVFGPFMGGVIVTYKSWRVIFYLQTGLAGLGTALMLSPLLPETIHNFTKATEMSALSRGAYFRELASLVNPMRVLRLFLYPNIICVGLASSALSWNMYSLLTPITHVLNPRFGLSSPIQSALFYLAPGVGYIVGTLVGGKWADRVVIKNIKKRNGERVAEDRLKSCLVALGIVIPASMLIYGWSVEKEFGGIPLPVIMMFSQAVAQLFVYPSINAYCLDVMQHKGWSAEVTAGNYLIRWMFAAAGSASCLPAIQKIGLGWFEVISAGFLVFSAVLVWACSVWGRDWRETAARKRVWAD